MRDDDRLGHGGVAVIRWIGGCCLLLALHGCGKGGSHDAPTVPPPPASSAGTTTLAVISNTVPQEARAAVTEIVSPLASGSPNTVAPLAISQGDGDSMVLALNASGKIMLASVATGANTSMDANSTTLALARLMSGTVPEGHTIDQLNAAIRASESFEAAIGAVREAHFQGVAPSSSANVPPLLGAVVRQALVALDSTPVVGAVGAVRTLAITEKRVELPTPYVVLGDKKAGVFVTDGGVFLANTVPVIFSAHSSAAPGKLVKVESAAFKQTVAITVLGASDLSLALTQAPKTQLANNGGKAFEITVTQNEQSKTDNIQAITADAFAVLLSNLAGRQIVDKNCVAQLTNATFKAAEIADLIQTPSAKFLGKYLAATSLREIADALVKCAAGATKMNTKFAQTVMDFLADVSGATWTIDSIGLAAKIGAVVGWWDTPPTTVGVCESGGSSGFTLVNCTERIEVDTLSLSPGAVADIVIRTFDRFDKPTARSSGITVTAGNPSAIQVDQQAMTVTGLKEDFTAIEVKDKELGISKSALVEVVEPIFVPATLSLTAGAKGSIALRQKGNRRVTLPKTGMQFTTSNSSVAEFNIISSLFLERGEVSLTGNSPGNATIVATHPAWKSQPSAAITVTGGISAFRVIGYTPTECRVGSFQYITDGKKAFLRSDYATVYDYLCLGYTFPTRAIYTGPGYTRLEHTYGCEGLPDVSFDRNGGLAFASSYPNSGVTNSLRFSGTTSTTGTTETGVYTVTGTVFTIDLNAPSGTPASYISYSASGTWSSSPVPAFPKCLAPKTPAPTDPPRFCPSFLSDDSYGCDYRRPSDPPREGEW